MGELGKGWLRGGGHGARDGFASLSVFMSPAPTSGTTDWPRHTPTPPVPRAAATQHGGLPSTPTPRDGTRHCEKVVPPRTWVVRPAPLEYL